VEHEKAQEQEDLERILDDVDIEGTYRRELWARMYGGKLTARQYGVLMNMSHDSDEIKQNNKVQHFKDQIEARDSIRNKEEITESYRRFMISQGNWKEEESYGEL